MRIGVRHSPRGAASVTLERHTTCPRTKRRQSLCSSWARVNPKYKEEHTRSIGRSWECESPLWTSQGTGKVEVERDPLKWNQETIKISDIWTAQDLQNYWVQLLLRRMRNLFVMRRKYQSRVPLTPLPTPSTLYIPSKSFLCLLVHSLLWPHPPSFPLLGNFPGCLLTLASCFCLSDNEDLGGSAACQPFCSLTCLSSAVPYVYVSQSLEDVACARVGPPQPYRGCWALS